MGLPRRRMGRLGSLIGWSKSDVLVAGSRLSALGPWLSVFGSRLSAFGAWLGEGADAGVDVEDVVGGVVVEDAGGEDAEGVDVLDCDDVEGAEVPVEGCDDDGADAPVEGAGDGEPVVADGVLAVDDDVLVAGVLVEAAVVEPAAGLDSSLSAAPAARRCSTGRSSLFSSSITGGAYFFDVSGGLAPAGSQVPSAIQSWRSCPGCVMVNRPCDTPVRKAS